MLKEELMIGDLVMYQGLVVKVASIRDDNFIGIQRIDGDDDTISFVDSLSLKPIPLTAKTLEENRWKPTEENLTYNCCCFQITKSPQGWYISTKNNHNFICTVKSVSELQHFLTLTGLYSNIKLSQDFLNFKVIQLQSFSHQTDSLFELVPKCIGNLEGWIDKGASCDLDFIYHACNPYSTETKVDGFNERAYDYGFDFYPTIDSRNRCENDIYVISNDGKINVLTPSGWLSVGSEKEAQLCIINNIPRYSLDNVYNANDFK